MTRQTHHPSAEVRPFPALRQLTADTQALAAERHTMYALIEVDVTEARARLYRHQHATGEHLSFTAFLVACLGWAVARHREVQAMRDGRGRLVVFDDVDVGTLFEVRVDGAPFTLGHVIHAANRRSYHDIHEEIRAVQANPDTSPTARLWPAARWFVRLPRPLRFAVYRWLGRQPGRFEASLGTVALSAVGMFGAGSGWGLSRPTHGLSVTVGGIGVKPSYLDGQVVPREWLCLTVAFDHDVIDGAPAARFVRDLRALIEGAEVLDELDGQPPARKAAPAGPR